MASVHPLSAEDKRHILQDPFVVVRTVQAIPKLFLTPLVGINPATKMPNTADMANPGQTFQTTDVGSPGPGHPFRRLVFAVVSPQYCLVYYELGGIAYRRDVSLYRMSAGQARLVWQADLRSYSNKLSLTQLRSEISHGRYDSDMFYSPYL